MLFDCAALSNSVNRASISSVSIALIVWFRMLSQPYLVAGGVPHGKQHKAKVRGEGVGVVWAGPGHVHGPLGIGLGWRPGQTYGRSVGESDAPVGAGRLWGRPGKVERYKRRALLEAGAVIDVEEIRVSWPERTTQLDPRQPRSLNGRRSGDPSSGRLKNGNPAGDPSTAPRCGAKTRRDWACRAPAMRNPNTGRYTRCRMHGGASTGSRTPDGPARCRKARWKTARSAAARANVRPKRGTKEDSRRTPAPRSVASRASAMSNLPVVSA